VGVNAALLVGARSSSKAQGKWPSWASLAAVITTAAVTAEAKWS